MFKLYFIFRRSVWYILLLLSFTGLVFFIIDKILNYSGVSAENRDIFFYVFLSLQFFLYGLLSFYLYKKFLEDELQLLSFYKEEFIKSLDYYKFSKACILLKYASAYDILLKPACAMDIKEKNKDYSFDSIVNYISTKTKDIKSKKVREVLFSGNFGQDYCFENSVYYCNFIKGLRKKTEITAEDEEYLVIIKNIKNFERIKILLETHSFEEVKKIIINEMINV